MQIHSNIVNYIHFPYFRTKQRYHTCTERRHARAARRASKRWQCRARRRHVRALCTHGVPRARRSAPQSAVESERAASAGASAADAGASAADASARTADASADASARTDAECEPAPTKVRWGVWGRAGAASRAGNFGHNFDLGYDLKLPIIVITQLHSAYFWHGFAARRVFFAARAWG